MSNTLLTEHRLEFLSLTGGCTGSSESTLVKKSTSLVITFRGSYRLYGPYKILYIQKFLPEFYFSEMH